ncbi:hypothetical protein FQN54_009730 [Arachnomyces sp. PD_36]|nr:hypothetical protein FQN54_009730 [Arachnomyces sp. PD_36]
MAAAMLSSSVVDAHMVMVSPVPYMHETLDNFPLAADGSDFPCKLQDGLYDSPSPATNKMAIGEPQTLSFMGSAVHGGGSCQISLTTDMQPTPESQWQVIHSIEGGCPAGIGGNFPENAAGRQAPDFQYTIPDGIAPGEYTLAWTWFNKVGNREMYMNCAPITVEAGSSKRDEMKSKREPNFPSMFVANIAGHCTTDEGVDIVFPEAGDSVEQLATNPDTLGPPPPECGTAPSGGSNSGSTHSSPKPATPVAAQPEPETPDAPAPETPEAPAPEQPEPEVPSEPTTPETPSAPSGSGNALSGPCSTEGDWNCIGGSSFQRCASGAWSAAQPMAAGTSCEAGQGASLAMVTAKRAVHSRDFHSRRRSIEAIHV